MSESVTEINDDFSAQSYIYGKIFMKIRSVCRLSIDVSQIVANALSRNVEESFKIFLCPDPEADEFQTSISSSLFTDTSVAKFS